MWFNIAVDGYVTPLLVSVVAVPVASLVQLALHECPRAEAVAVIVVGLAVVGVLAVLRLVPDALVVLALALRVQLLLLQVATNRANGRIVIWKMTKNTNNSLNF